MWCVDQEYKHHFSVKMQIYKTEFLVDSYALQKLRSIPLENRTPLSPLPELDNPQGLVIFTV